MVGKLVSASDLARETGMTKQAISKAIRSGRIVPDDKTKSGRDLFYLEKNKKILEEQSGFNVDQSRHEGLPKSLMGGHLKSQPVTNRLTNDACLVDESNEAEPLDRRYLKARAERAELAARAEAIKIAQLEGELISVEVVKQQGAELGAVVIGTLSLIPDRLSPELSTMDDQHEIHAILTSEINKLVNEIRKKLSLGKADE